jgi:hypothetical protein
VLQERSMNQKGEEVVHLGTFLKDGPDVEPFPLMESDHQSFYWEVVIAVPQNLEGSYDAMYKAGSVRDRATAVTELRRAYRLWSVCVCHRPKELLRQPQVHSGDSRRGMVYRRKTRKPQRGMNSKRRSASWS